MKMTGFSITSSNKNKEIFSKYSQKDIIKSLFILSTWKNNRAASIKTKHAYIVLFSNESFSSEDKIKNYEDFFDFKLL